MKALHEGRGREAERAARRLGWIARWLGWRERAWRAGGGRARRGRGRVPLFGVDAFARADDSASPQAALAQPVAIVPKSVDYWVRGIFRHGDGRQTHTVRAVGMSARLDADMARFVRYLTDAGFRFAEGRGYLAELLGVGTDDGEHIAFSAGTADAERVSDARQTEPLPGPRGPARGVRRR